MRSVRAGSVCVDLATAAEGVLPAEDDEPAVPLAELPWPDDWDALLDSPVVAFGVEARGDRCAWSTACSTSTATGSRSSWCAASSTSGPRAPHPPST